MNINHKTNLIVIIYGIILILGIFVAFQGSNYAFMNGDDVTRIDGDDFLMSLNRRIMLFGDSEKQSFVTTLDEDEFPKIDGSDYSLIIFRLASNGYKVYFNNHFIGAFRQYETGNSNLWNGIKRYNIPKEWVSETNHLRIENHSKYMTGLTTHPMFLTSVDKATQMVALSQLYNHNAVMASLGISFLAIIILLVLYWTSKQRGKMYISLAFAMLFLGIYSMDYGTSEYVFMSYMLYKKIIMISFWISTFFVGLGLRQIFGHTLPVTVGTVGLVGIIIMALFSSDLIMFKTLYSYWYISQILNVITWLYVVFKNISNSIEARVFFFLFWRPFYL